MPFCVIVIIALPICDFKVSVSNWESLELWWGIRNIWNVNPDSYVIGRVLWTILSISTHFFHWNLYQSCFCELFLAHIWIDMSFTTILWRMMVTYLVIWTLFCNQFSLELQFNAIYQMQSKYTAASCIFYFKIINIIRKTAVVCPSGVETSYQILFFKLYKLMCHW